MTARTFVLPPNRQFDAAAQEEMAKSFHVRFVANSANRLPTNMRPWEKLDETFKKANIEQARYSVQILEAAGFGVRPAKEPVVFDHRDFTDPEVEFMANMEHGRWNVERLRDGWRYGKVRDDSRKIHNCLVSWADLPDDIKPYDREAVRAFPEILAKAGLEVYRAAQGSK